VSAIVLSLLIFAAPIESKIRMDVSKEADPKSSAAFCSMQRMVIKNADIHCEVTNCQSSVSQLKDFVENIRGIVVSSTETNLEDNLTVATIVITIPAISLDEAMEEILRLSSKVLEKSTFGSDVTADYTRITSLLESKKSSNEQFKKMQHSAKKFDEIIAIEKYYAEVKAEIERLEAEQQSLNDKASQITIEIKFQQIPEANGTSNDLRNVGTGVGRNLTGAANILDIGIAFLSTAIPVILLILIPAYFLFKLGKKYKLVKKNETSGTA